MEFEELERAAFCRRALGDYVSLPDLLCWHTLRVLYAEFGQGLVSKEEAARQKRLIQKQWEQAHQEFERMRDTYRQFSEMVRHTEEVRAEINKKGCPLCKRLTRILDGRDRT